MAKIRYKGTSTVREVTTAQLENAGMPEHEGMEIYVDTRKGERARVVDVSDAVAARLLELEPDDWEGLSEETIARLEAVDEQYKNIEESRAVAAEAAAAEEEASKNKWLANLEQEAAAKAEEEQDQADLEKLRNQ